MTKAIRIGTWAVLALSAADVWAQDWPQWRGPNRDNKVVGFKAPATWPKELKEKWTAPVGEGVSSPVLAGGKIYAFGRIGPDEVTTCLDAESGKQLWQVKYKTGTISGAPSGGGKFAGTRSTPAVAEGKVCTLGSSGAVTCLDAVTGKELWRKGDEIIKPRFFTSTSPLIVDGKVIVYLNALTAFDLTSGDVKWQWDGSKESDDTPYGSPVLMNVGGRKQIVTPTIGAVVGVDLADGKILWKYETGSPAYQATYHTPVIDGDTVYYFAPAAKFGKGGKGGKGGASGTMAFKVEKNGDAFAAAPLWKVDVPPHEYNTPVLKDGLLFGLSTTMNFYCMDAKNGKELWKDSTNRGQTAAILSAGSVLLALSQSTGLVAFEPNSKGYTEIANYKVSATPGYTYPVVSENRVFVKGERDLTLWTIE